MKFKSLYMLNSFSIGILFLMMTNVLFSQQDEFFSKENFIRDGDTLKYRIMFPKDFKESKSYPLVIFLHGRGESGDDNQKQLTHGSNLFIKSRDSFPAIVIFPQCPKEDYWSNADVDRTTNPFSLIFPIDKVPNKSLKLVMELLEETLNNSFVNKQQIYVGGLSMGGMGTYEILYRKPQVFAAGFVICGAGNPDATKAYAETIPLWIFHGANDDIIDPKASLKMVGAILKNGGRPNFTLYSKDNHNSWDSAFAESRLIPWLFSNTKTQQ